MNVLTLTTTSANEPNVFDVYWMTGLVQKGRVRVHMRSIDGNQVAAELAAAQYLLTEKNVCGHNKAGGGLKLIVSQQQVLDLSEAASSMKHLYRYANFLRTRYLGAQVVLGDARYAWADEGCDRQVDAIYVDRPAVTTLEVNGIGKVELTAHAIDRYVHRFDRKPHKAWRELTNIAKEVQPVNLLNRKPIHDIKHRQPGYYALDAKRNMLFVLTNDSRSDYLPRLVTVTRPLLGAHMVPMDPHAARPI